MKYPVNRLFAWGGVAAVAVAVALLWRHELGPSGASRLTLESAGAAGPTIGGSFTLVDHNGKTVTARDFRGRFMLVYFGYTYCPDVCPTTLTTMADAIDILDGESGRLIWRGTATAEVREGTSTEVRSERVAEAVQKVLAQFPSR